MEDYFKLSFSIQRNIKMKLVQKIKEFFYKIANRKKVKKRMEELRKRDPFIY